MHTRILMLSALLMAGGCKWKKEAEALAAQLTETETALEAAKAESKSRAETIDTLEAEVVDLESQIADLKTSIEGLEADLDTERERSANMLSDRGALRKEVKAMKEALADLEARRDQAEARVAAYRDLVGRFQEMIDAGKLDVRIVDGRMVVVLATDILFDSGVAVLSDEGESALGEVATVLASIEDNRYQVEGHTDDVPISTKQYPSNWYLAAARAIGVVNAFVDAGLEPARVSAASFGDTRPVADNSTKEGRALNRRIEIVVVPDLSELPGYDELEALETDD